MCPEYEFKNNIETFSSKDYRISPIKASMLTILAIYRQLFDASNETCTDVCLSSIDSHISVPFFCGTSNYIYN